MRPTAVCRRRRWMTWCKKCSSSSIGSCPSSKAARRCARGSLAIVRRVVADYVQEARQSTGRRRAARARTGAGVAPRGQAIERKAALEVLDALLARMSEDQREVFVLHEIEHMSGAGDRRADGGQRKHGVDAAARRASHLSGRRGATARAPCSGADMTDFDPNLAASSSWRARRARRAPKTRRASSDASRSRSDCRRRQLRERGDGCACGQRRDARPSRLRRHGDEVVDRRRARVGAVASYVGFSTPATPARPRRMAQRRALRLPRLQLQPPSLHSRDRAERDHAALPGSTADTRPVAGQPVPRRAPHAASSTAAPQRPRTRAASRARIAAPRASRVACTRSAERAHTAGRAPRALPTLTARARARRTAGAEPVRARQERRRRRASPAACSPRAALAAARFARTKLRVEVASRACVAPLIAGFSFAAVATTARAASAQSAAAFPLELTGTRRRSAVRRAVRAELERIARVRPGLQLTKLAARAEVERRGAGFAVALYTEHAGESGERRLEAADC